MNYKKVFKRETRVIAYVVIALTLVVIGTSYALFLQVNNNSNNQVVKAGSLTITYSNGNTVTANSTDKNNNCLTPMSDTNAATKGCKFTLSVTNTGTLPMQYNLLIYDDTSESNRVEHTLIKHTLSKQISKSGSTTNSTVRTNTLLSNLTTSNSKRVLETNTINVGETIVFTLNIWISDTAPVATIGKNVSLKLDVAGLVKETDSGNYGDAFNCDVNGDGIFDSTTERFYYVADADSNTAALIYYSNTVNGVPSTSEVTYSASNLPTTAQWKNVATIRSLKYSEVQTACGSTNLAGLGSLDKCSYLLENTWYQDRISPSYRLDDNYYIYVVNRGVSTSPTNTTGVRPAINVPKANMIY